MNIYISGAVTGVKDYRYIFTDKTWHLNKILGRKEETSK